MTRHDMHLIVQSEIEPWLTFRQYKDGQGNAVCTYEVPSSVVMAFGMARLHQQLDAWRRGEEKRSKSEALRTAIISRLRDKIKPLAIAHELGCSEAYVRQLRKVLNEQAR